MEPDTIEEVENKRNDLIAVLKNNPDLPSNLVEMFEAKIDMYEAQIDMIKSLG